MDYQELESLIKLQSIQTAYDLAAREIGEIPELLEEQETKMQLYTSQRDEVHLKVENNRKAQKHLEQEIEDYKQHLIRLNKQLFEVKNNKEYSAMVSEISTIKGKISQTEDKILLIMEETEVLTIEMKSADAVFFKQQAEIDVIRTALEARRTELTAQLEVLTVELVKCKALIPDRLMAEYMRIRDYTGTTVVAPVTKRGTQHVCGGCYMNIPPQSISDLRKGSVFQCEACARFLYWSDNE